MDILCYPNDLLRRKTQTVTQFDDQLRQTAEMMFATVKRANGVGLAATQVGLALRLCVIHLPPPQEGDVAMVNPLILERHETVTSEEGCLSFPGIFIEIARAARVKVRYQDLEGREHIAEVTGLTARAVQHELDHLDGVLLLDKMTTIQRLAHRGELKMLEVRHQRRKDDKTRAAE